MTHNITNIDNALSRIKSFKAMMGFSNNKLAKQAGIAEGTVRNIEDSSWNPQVETVRKIEAIIPSDFNGASDA